jgi:fructokinase
MGQLGLGRQYIQIHPEYPTGTVSVELAKEGIPTYTIHENVAWDYITWTRELESLAAEVEAVCFGSLAQRNQASGSTIQRFLKATRPECLRVCDINLRQSFYDRKTLLASLELCNVLKLNEDELPVLAGFLGLHGSEEEALGRLLQEYRLKLIAYTKGSQGSWLITPEESSAVRCPRWRSLIRWGQGIRLRPRW